jgi:hypothetical protein
MGSCYPALKLLAARGVSGWSTPRFAGGEANPKTSSRLRVPVYNHILEPETFDAAGRELFLLQLDVEILEGNVADLVL